jgi:N-acetylglucosaminyl-diphospho-decaprenol L-rhamnosyltransferase
VLSRSDVRVLVAVVNYQTPDLTIDCLASLEAERCSHPALRAVVADAASGDGSAARIRAAIESRGWRDWACVLPLPRNGGFSYGNNAVIRAVLAEPDPPDLIHLLNPDTVVRPGAVDALVSFMEQNPTVGIAGSRLEDPDGTPQISAFRFPSALGELETTLRFGPASRLLGRWRVAPPAREEPHPTDWVAGASMMVRRRVFEEVGLLDEGYFLYFEEVDFCLAARRAGWSCWYVPASRVVHLVARATGVSELRVKAKRRPAYWFESRRRFYLKNFSPWKALGADMAGTLGFALWRVRRFLQTKPDLDPPHFLADLMRHSVLRTGFRL